MRLIYFDATKGKNFGDLLNGPIFDHYLPGFFDQDDGIHFLGIGSILGLPFAKSRVKKIVFSSGFAYGEPPTIDSSYDFFCVRGPITAQRLNLPAKLAIADGAYLLHGLRNSAANKKYECSVMLHWHSLLKFDWRPLCEELGLHFIDPSDPTDRILDEISGSKLILAEAMHGAIAADAMRVPWVPIACYDGVNSLKWTDFTQSVHLNYEPVRINSLYMHTEYVAKIIDEKSKGLVNINRQPARSLFNLSLKYQNRFTVKKTISQLKAAQKRGGGMSADTICKDRYDRLVEKIHDVRKKYGAAR